MAFLSIESVESIFRLPNTASSGVEELLWLGCLLLSCLYFEGLYSRLHKGSCFVLAGVTERSCEVSACSCWTE